MRQVLVLCYHALSPDWDADLAIPPSAFDRQVGHLLRRGWRAVTFTEAVTGTEPGRLLAITFDDAFASVRRYAEPILARHGAVATVFAPTDFMDGGAQLQWDGIAHWRRTGFAGELEAMDWSDLRDLADGGWEIGSHTCSHPSLPTLDDEGLARELTRSRARCADELGRECRSIAYPYGDLDPRVVAAAAAAGYEAAARLSGDLRPAGPLAFPRVGIYHSDSGPRFRLKAATPVRWLRASRVWPR